MPETRLSRWQWARQHTELGWREILGALGGAAVHRWGFGMSPDVAVIPAAIGGGAFAYAVDFTVKFLRARIEQERIELAECRKNLRERPSAVVSP